jgi:hypothetical protein
MLDERPINSFEEDFIGFEPAVEGLATLLVESMNETALASHKPAIKSLLTGASATRNPRRAKRILRRLTRLRQIDSDKDLYVIIMGIVLAETWPELYSWFWVCSIRHWNLMLIELRGGDSGALPSYATDQSQEFLSAILERLKIDMNNLPALRETFSRHRSMLDI